MARFTSVFKEGVVRVKREEVLRRNIEAAKFITERLSSILGPKGSSKMLIDKDGVHKCSTDAAIILKSLFIDHPVAKIMADLGQTTKRVVGDGTASTVILAGALLERAGKLLARNIHPAPIINGYVKAMSKALEIYDEIAVGVDPADIKTLRQVAMTAANKIPLEDRPHLMELILDAVMRIVEREEEGYKVDLRAIKLVKQPGESLSDTQLIVGSATVMDVLNKKMPRRIEKAKIALLDSPIQVQRTKYDAKVTITEPGQLDLLMSREDEMLRDLVDKIVSSGANVVVNQKFVDELAGYYFARRGVLAIRWEGEYEMECLRKATGGKSVKNIDDLTPEDLGYAGLVEERKVGKVKWIFFEGCKKPKSLTIMIRGPTPDIIDSSLSSMGDALFAVRDVMRDPRIVAGGGATEIEVATRLRGWALKLSGREQLAALSFAEALKAIPLKLAENAGLNPLDALAKLTAHHKGGEVWAGIDAFDGEVKDMMEIAVVDPVSVKEQTLKSACEATSMVLRIDDLIAIRR